MKYKQLFLIILIIISGIIVVLIYKNIKIFPVEIVEINNTKYYLDEFNKTKILLKTYEDIQEKEILDKFIEYIILINTQEIKNIKINEYEILEIYKNFKEKFINDIIYKNFLIENKIVESDVKDFLKNQLKIKNFFIEKTKDIVLTEEDKNKIYQEIEKTSAYLPPEFMSRYKEKFENSILQSKKDAYKKEFIKNLIKKSKIKKNVKLIEGGAL